MAGFFGQMMDPETMGLLGMSAGLLQAGGPSRMPVSTGQALSQGLMGGMSGYGQGTQLQQQALQHKAAMAKMARELQIQEASAALHGGAGAQQATPQAPPAPPAPPALPIQLAGLSPQSAGAVGAPWEEAPPPPPLPPQLPQQAAARREFQPPYSQTALSRAQGQGVNVEQAIKQNAEARAQWELQNPKMDIHGGYVVDARNIAPNQFLPTIGTQDTGGALRDYRTGPQGERTYLGTTPKTGAPGSIPFEMSDQTPPQARAFDLARRAAGATNITVGNKEADKKFAGDFVEFATGGYADVVRQLEQLRKVSASLGTAAPGSLSGTVVGNLPESVRSALNPQAQATKDAVEEVVQRNLRLVLGAQFTAQEGERLIARAYNPRLSEVENKKRVDSLISQISQAAEAKLGASRYFMANGTLEGWKGKIWTMSDFDPEKAAGKGGGGGAAPTFSPATLEFLKKNNIPVPGQ